MFTQVLSEKNLYRFNDPAFQQHDMEADEIIRRFEKISTIVFTGSDEASGFVAREIANLIREKGNAGMPCVLGLATGSTPLKVYTELIRIHKEEGLSFRNVITFNLDEYYPMNADSLQSYRRFMKEYLFDHIDILPENIHIPDGTIPRSEVYAFCCDYEEAIQKAGGLDLQILVIGRTGHIGFNETGSSKSSVTRLITLDHLTRSDAASDFYGEENGPERAITMGVGSILKSKRILLLAFGEGKAAVLAQSIEGEITDHVPASFLQEHPNDNGMSDLMTEHGPSNKINIQVFNDLQHTISGWPAGKPNADDSTRPERALPYPKKVLVFSPHPDDDVISMGGTLARLVDQGHDVFTAYQTSGSIAVPLSPEEVKIKRRSIFSTSPRKTGHCFPASTSVSSGKERKTGTPPQLFIMTGWAWQNTRHLKYL